MILKTAKCKVGGGEFKKPFLVATLNNLSSLRSLHEIAMLSNKALTMRLDKNYYIKHSFSKAADHQAQYKEMSAKEQSDTFRIRMEAAYGFVGLPWPKMDKQYFEKKSRR